MKYYEGPTNAHRSDLNHNAAVTAHTTALETLRVCPIPGLERFVITSHHPWTPWAGVVAAGRAIRSASIACFSVPRIGRGSRMTVPCRI